MTEYKNKIFKEPDFNDPFYRYFFDCAYKDFVARKTLFGKILYIPFVFIIAMLIVLIMYPLYYLDKMTNKENPWINMRYAPYKRA